MTGKTLEEHFREQAELIDRLFVYRFEEFDRAWESKLESKLKAKLRPIRRDLAELKVAVKPIFARLPLTAVQALRR